MSIPLQRNVTSTQVFGPFTDSSGNSVTGLTSETALIVKGGTTSTATIALTPVATFTDMYSASVLSSMADTDGYLKILFNGAGYLPTWLIFDVGDSPTHRAASIASVKNVAVTDINDFKATITGLSTYDHTSDEVIVATNNDKTGYATTQGDKNTTTETILDYDFGTGTDTANRRGVRNALRFLVNKWEIISSTLHVKKEDDTTDAWTSAVTTGSGDPITSVDPN